METSQIRRVLEAKDHKEAEPIQEVPGISRFRKKKFIRREIISDGRVTVFVPRIWAIRFSRL